MRSILKGTAIALALAGAASMSAAADDYGRQGGDSYSGDSNIRHDDSRLRAEDTIQFGDVALGYRDGYWDRSHGWHRWNGDNDYQTYRTQHADTYRDYNHDRDANGAPITLAFGDVALGYRDGYWDRNHGWHRWNGDNDFQAYRAQHADNYRDYDHDRDGGYNGVVTVSFADVSMGYRDGYWDNNRQWHHWRNARDYRTFRGQHGSKYHDWNHNRHNGYGWTQH